MVFRGRLGRAVGSPVPLLWADEEADGALVSCDDGGCKAPADAQDAGCAFGAKKEVILVGWLGTCAGLGAHRHVAVRVHPSSRSTRESGKKQKGGNAVFLAKPEAASVSCARSDARGLRAPTR